jgi:hypothetical protein
MSTIPASAIVNIVPNVLAAGGSALDLSGLFLSTNTRVPIGTVKSFSNLTDVQTYFGAGATESTAAGIYFLGFDNSNNKPGAILFAQYPTAAVSAYLRGGSVAALTLAQLQAITPGTLTVLIGGVSKVSSSIDLSSATSFSNAATIITAAFTSPGFVVTYDSVSGGFVFTSTATGSAATLTFATTNAFATALKLTSATGAVLSQGTVAADPATFMAAIVAQTQDWATFATLFDPDVSGNANKLLFATWVNLQNNRYCYVCWDTDVAPAAAAPAASSLGYILKNGDYSGTCMVWAPTYDKAAFVCGTAASIDFEETNGRTTFAFRAQTGLVADVTDQTTGDKLIANGYNFYGAYATANDQFVFFYPGSVTGQFEWMDSYINEIWLNNAFQLALMVLLTNAKSIPYNTAGYALIEASCNDVIIAGLNFGAFRPGVTLSQAQIAEVNSAAGVIISNILQQRGWYLQIKDASPQVRQARGTPPMTFWYMDGQSVQKITLVSVNVQ